MDIVEQLRRDAYAPHFTSVGAANLMIAAADEIDRLRAISKDGYCIKDSEGRLSGFRLSRRDIETALVGTYYSPAGMLDDPAYRAAFDKDLTDALEHRGLAIVACRMTLSER